MDTVSRAFDSDGCLCPRAAQQGASTATVNGLCLHQLFEEQARRTPDFVALVFEEHRLSYSELNRRADQLACYLRDRGIAPDTRVGLFMERSAAMIVGMLGILKAGGAYVPIDPAYPQARIAFMLEDADAKLLLTQSILLPRLASNRPEAVCVDSSDWSTRNAESGIGIAPRPEDLAYVIYTSGSTGRPKGVCIEHRNIVNYARGVAARLRFQPGRSYALVSSIAADLGNTVIFPALMTGGCLHVISRERAEDQALLSEYFNRERIDVLKIAPSHLAALQSGRNPERVMPQSQLILGGEATPLGRVEWLRALSPNCEIYNHYGPTETTVGVLMYRVGERLPDTESGALPLGTPLPNTHAHILTSDGHPALTGERGEIYIGGSGVARGYLNRPDLSAEKFVPDPFSSDPEARLYRTGDLGRRLPDGNIEYCGRTDNEVKISGYRVALEEIEQALRELGGVRDVVTIARDTSSGGKQLVAHIIPKRAHQPLWAFPTVHILPDGSPVAHLNKNETDYIYNEIFVLQAYLRHGITIRKGDCIVDAGANIGLFTVFANRLAPDLRIISLEPNPTAFACLKANAEAWGATVACLPFGVSDTERVAELTSFDGFSLLSGFYADSATERSVVETYVHNQQPLSADNPDMVSQIDQLIDNRLRATKVSARLRTLASIIEEQGIDRIDLLKINVEKSELDVLRGLAARDWPKVRQMVIEVDRKDNLNPIVALLERNGFEFLIEQDPLLKKTELCYVYAIRPQGGRGLVRGTPSDAHLRAIGPARDEILTPGVLRRHLSERLPRYMVPHSFLLMDKFPLLPNGKVDRQALPLCESTQHTADFAEPRTNTERALAAIWSELLETENIGVNDDFFELGGHSLLAIKMVSRLRDVFEVDAQLPILFEFPTLGGLASVVDGLLGGPNADRREPRSLVA